MPWSVTEYITKLPGATRVPKGEHPPAIDPKEKERIQKFFATSHIGEQKGGCVVIDHYGRILIWHLPLVLPIPRRVSIFYKQGNPDWLSQS